MKPSPDVQTPQSIKVVEERLLVDREVEETGAWRVRVKTSVHTEVLSAPVTERGVAVERIQRDLPVDERQEPWRDGEVLVVPVYEEVVVRQLILKEELRLTPTERTHHEAQHVALLSESVIFERSDADGQWHEVPMEQVSFPAGR
jgi:stress response protein YsnF